jgi:hypothetical protein
VFENIEQRIENITIFVVACSSVVARLSVNVVLRFLAIVVSTLRAEAAVVPREAGSVLRPTLCIVNIVGGCGGGYIVVVISDSRPALLTVVVIPISIVIIVRFGVTTIVEAPEAGATHKGP